MIPRLLGLARNDFVLDVVYFLVLTTYSLVLLIDTEMKKVTFKSRENAEKKKSKEVLLVHPLLSCFAQDY